jgi:hypothetical protein
MYSFRWRTSIFPVCLVFFLTVQSVAAQQPFHIYLIGDAGDHREGGETLVSLQKELIRHPNSAIVYLGDNSYKDILWGVVPFGYKGFDSSRNTIDKIRSQLAILDQYHGYVYFVPGNHDWWNRTSYQKGWRKLAMEEHFIEANLRQNSNIANPGNPFLPSHGDYGPAFVELDSNRIRLVFIDTYRIIQNGIKKTTVPEEEKTFYKRLDSVIADGYVLKQKIVVLAHHPVYATGPYTRVLKHPYFNKRIKASLSHFPSYQNMSAHINEILMHYPGIYYASGHVHALQYFYTKDSIHFIISGAGSQDKILSVKDKSKYDGMEAAYQYLLWNTGGFFELCFDGQTENTILYYDNGLLKCNIP